MTQESQGPSPGQDGPTPSGIKLATLHRIAATGIWIESNVLGECIVVVQHEGCDPFDYATFGHDHRYTSNSIVRDQARRLALSLGAREPVMERFRILRLTSPEEIRAQIVALQELLAQGSPRSAQPVPVPKTCDHQRNTWQDGGVHDITGEPLDGQMLQEATYEDLGAGRFRCTQCGEVGYYTGLWRDFHERGTPCPGSDRERRVPPAGTT